MEVVTPPAAPSLADLAAHLERTGREAGLDAVGIAGAEPFDEARATLERRKAEGLHGGMQFTYRNPSRSTDPGQALDGARALVVGARSYRRDDPDPDPDQDQDHGQGDGHGHDEPGHECHGHGDGHGHDEPGHERHAHDDHHHAGPPATTGAVARYSWIDHYEPLRTALEAVAGELRAAGWRARVLADENALVDRAAAQRAGLGFFGKNTNLLLHGGRGSEFVLGSVVTDAPLPAHADDNDNDNDDDTHADDNDNEKTGCGPCERCLPACPTGALVAPGVLDARRCLAWLLQAEGDFPPEHRRALGGRIYGCDACQDACPPNRLEIRRRPPPPAEAHAEPEVDLVALLATEDDDELLARYGRWYIARRQGRYLRRNALVALGNVGDPDDPATRRVIAAHLARHDDPMLREHAAWADAELGAPRRPR